MFFVFLLAVPRLQIRLWILIFDKLYTTCDVTVMDDESAVGLVRVETN